MVFELVCTYLRSQKQRLSLLGLACLILRVFLSDVADSLTGPDAGEVPGGAYPSLTHIWLWAQHPWNQPVAPFLSFISRVIMEDTLRPAAFIPRVVQVVLLPSSPIKPHLLIMQTGMDPEGKGHSGAWPTMASSCDSWLLVVEAVGVRVRALAPRSRSLGLHTPRQWTSLAGRE